MAKVGWICPRCKKSNAPFVSFCDCGPPKCAGQVSLQSQKKIARPLFEAVGGAQKAQDVEFCAARVANLFERPNSVAKYRKAEGLSQRKLAGMIGIHWVTLSRIERGERTLQRPQMIRLGEVFGIDPARLLDSRPSEVNF